MTPLTLSFCRVALYAALASTFFVPARASDNVQIPSDALAGYVAARDWGCKTSTTQSGCPAFYAPPPRHDIPA